MTPPQDAREIVDDHKAIRDRYTHSLLFFTNIICAIPLFTGFSPALKQFSDVLRTVRFPRHPLPSNAPRRYSSPRVGARLAL